MSASPAERRRKGRAAEREVVTYLREQDIPVEDLNRSGFDGGDLEIDEVIAGEVKNHVSYDFPSWLRQAKAQAMPGQIPVVFAKRNKTTDVSKWFVVLELGEAVALIRYAIKGWRNDR